MFFTEESLPLHQSDDQITRQFSSKEVVLSSFDKAAMSGISSTEHFITLSACSCLDFSTRKLPCKHMYHLASKLDLFKFSSNQRSLELIADFSDGFAKDWKFAIPTSSFAALDILWTPRVSQSEKSKGDKELVLTQGSLYNFQSGSVYYDTSLAYQKSWKEALSYIQQFVQIKSVTPSSPKQTVLFDNGLLVNSTTISYGVVTFSLFKVDPITQSPLPPKIKKCTQNHFVEFLKTGQLQEV